jgi:hypothetical protein
MCNIGYPFEIGKHYLIFDLDIRYSQWISLKCAYYTLWRDLKLELILNVINVVDCKN